MKTPLLLAVVALLAGCAAQVPGDPRTMSPEQITARPAKNAAIGCIWVRTLVAETVSVFADVDLIRKGQSVSIGSDCSVQIGGEPE
jgi:hypothetical protein